jgi:hypothetical protein
MSAKKKSPAVKAKAAPGKIEHSGHWIEGNIWFHLGLSKTEAAMLKAVSGNLCTKKLTSAYAARILLQAALAHFDVIKPLIIRDSIYSVAEGFNGADKYLQGVIRQQHAKIAGVKAGAK